MRDGEEMISAGRFPDAVGACPCTPQEANNPRESMENEKIFTANASRREVPGGGVRRRKEVFARRRQGPTLHAHGAGGYRGVVETDCGEKAWKKRVVGRGPA